MPLRNLITASPETLSDMLLAADDRYQEAEELLMQQRFDGCVYLLVLGSSYIGGAMPVRRLSPARAPAQSQLVDRLADEWKSPVAGSTEPVVVEETDAKGNVVHLYVVWSDWAQLDRIRRGEVIMEAAERVMPVDDVLKITIAMGLTPAEADSFGLKWR